MMHQEKITAIFDHQAPTYDQKWIRLAPINHALHLLTSAVLARLPADARILCVGAGTGIEIFHLAQQYPTWRFTAVEPSSAMLQVLQRKAEDAGTDIASRLTLHQGYLDTLPAGEPFHAATSFLVSQFLLEREARTAFFQAIAHRLIHDGMLISADLAGDLNLSVSVDADNHSNTTSPTPSLLEFWFGIMSSSGSLASPEEVQKMREAYSRDVSVLPPAEVRDIIADGGFNTPVQFYQAGMIHAWVSSRRR